MKRNWRIENSKENKLIIIDKDCIYKGNPVKNGLTNNDITTENLFSIPYAYITKIENQEGKNYVKIYFGDNSEEELIVDNDAVKNEIFDCLKSEITALRYTSELPSKFSYAKAPFFALFFITAIFIWTAYLAIQIESGVEYEVVGARKEGLVAFILGLANFGLLKIIGGYLLLLFFILIGLTRKLKTRSTIQTLKR